MDSDKADDDDEINDTKMRLQEGLADNGICWITKGREIENYISHDVLQAAVKAVYSDAYGEPAEGGIFDHALYFNRSTPKLKRDQTLVRKDGSLLEVNVDKVKVAREVCRHQADLNVLDLRENVERLVEMIKKANK